MAHLRRGKQWIVRTEQKFGLQARDVSGEEAEEDIADGEKD